MDQPGVESDRTDDGSTDGSSEREDGWLTFFLVIRKRKQKTKANVTHSDARQMQMEKNNVGQHWLSGRPAGYNRSRERTWPSGERFALQRSFSQNNPINEENA